MSLLKKKDEKIVRIVTEDYKNAEDVKEGMISQWQENYRMYRSKLAEEKEGRANLFIPYAFTIVEQMKAMSLNALFNRKPYVGFAAMSAGDVASAKTLEELVYFQMKDRIKLPDKFVDSLTDCFVYGTSIMRYSWKVKNKKVKRIKNVMEGDIKIDEEVIEDTVKIYDDPDVEVLDIDKVFPDPEGSTIEDCRFIIVKEYVTKKYLKDMEKAEVFDIPENFGEGNYDDVSLLDTFRANIDNSSTLANDNKKKKHELLSYYTDDEVVVVLDRRYVIRKEENPYYSKEKPFIKMVAFPVQRQFWGDSIIRIISSLQEELNTTRNQRLDNVSMALNAPLLKDVNDDILDQYITDDGYLDMSAGKIIEARDVERSLKRLQVPDVTSNAYMEENVIKGDMSYVSAVSEFSRGIQNTKRQTAQEIAAVQDATNSVFTYVVSLIENTGLIPLADAIKKLDQQFIDEDKIIRIFNPESADFEYKSYTADEIIGEFDVVSVNPRIETEQSKDAKRQQLVEVFNLLTSNPMTQGYINVKLFVEKLLETYEIKDFRNLLQNPQEQMPQPGQEQMPMQGEMPADNMPMQDAPMMGNPQDAQMEELQSILQGLSPEMQAEFLRRAQGGQV